MATKRRKRRKFEPKRAQLPKLEMKPVRCACGKPGRRGVTHTGVACYEEDQ
jgi:hypothetical protein